MKNHAKNPIANGRLPEETEVVEIRLLLASIVEQILEAEAERPGYAVTAAEPLYRRREELVHELEHAEKRAIGAHCIHAEVKYEARKAEWLDLQRQRALMILGLRRINAEIETLRAGLKSGGSIANLPCDGFSLRLLGSADAPGLNKALVAEYLRQCRNAGAISEKEIANA
jgi:hypothetical protein